MPHYVDIGVVRIQRYLSRTPTLAGRRAASAALVRATTVPADLLGDHARRNEQAGKVDGVLSLVVDSPEIRHTLLPGVLAHMRGELPGAEFQVTWGPGRDYLRASTEELKPRIARGDAQFDLPAGAEFPLAALCGICRVDPAIARVDLGADDGMRDACADCVMRHEPNARWQARLSTEHQLAKDVGVSGVPPGFNELAALAGNGNKEHLATVHADGNAVGQFFDTLARTGDVNLPHVVAELTRCTRDALAAATCAVRCRDDKALWVVPHVLGGDDVLVSLPADRAWRFTMEFVRDFGQRTTRLVRGLHIDGLTAPTMSAGMVFARRNYPFAMTVEHAERCLRQAKSEGAGTRACIGFADVVRDAAGASEDGVDRVPLGAAEHLGDKLSGLARLPRSSQVQLATALDRGGLERARAQAARLGHTEVITPFLLDGKAAAHEGDADVIGLGQALRIARWWPR